MERVFTIEDMYGGAWNNAVNTVAAIIGADTNKPNWWVDVEKACEVLGVRFTVDGDIIK